VYNVKPSLTTRLRKFMVDEDSFEGEFTQLPKYLGAMPEKAPSDFMDNVGLAQEMMKKMKIN
jgi:hypothetical protein